MSRVSICIPTYNHAAFVGEAIRSLLAQEFRDFDLYVVDDASTDDTGEVVRALLAQDPRVHYRRNAANLGCLGNGRECVREARGSLLWIFQSDDVCTDPGFLARGVRAFQVYPDLSFFYSACRLVDQHGRTLLDYVPRPEDALLDGRDALFRLLHTPCWPSATLMSAERFHRVGGYRDDIGLGNDFYTYLSLCLQGPVCYCARMMVTARVHETSNTGRLGDELYSVLDGPLAQFEAAHQDDPELVALVRSARRAYRTPHRTSLRCREHLEPLVSGLVDGWNRQGERIVVYGASVHTAQLFEWTPLAQAGILAIADRDRTLHGTRLRGYPVIAPEAIGDTGAAVVLVSSQRYQEEICADLARLGGNFRVVTLYPRLDGPAVRG
jgi:glycosyltransferase involved in cell wall biosynthesis